MARYGKVRTGEDNHMWRGGRSIASNGYVLVRVGRGHHLADVRGYAYEHRVVAEEKLGRWLKVGEVVHHSDENKQNNHPDNLEVKASTAHHFKEHRRSGRRRRDPDEANPTLPCACGCGGTLMRFDSNGRYREFITGHNPMPSPTMDAVVRSLSSGPKSRQQIAADSAKSPRVIATTLYKLCAARRVERVARGVWKLSEVRR